MAGTEPNPYEPGIGQVPAAHNWKTPENPFDVKTHPKVPNTTSPLRYCCTFHDATVQILLTEKLNRLQVSWVSTSWNVKILHLRHLPEYR